VAVLPYYVCTEKALGLDFGVDFDFSLHLTTTGQRFGIWEDNRRQDSSFLPWGTVNTEVLILVSPCQLFFLIMKAHLPNHAHCKICKYIRMIPYF
jgi:hypothetical protein